MGEFLFIVTNAIAVFIIVFLKRLIEENEKITATALFTLLALYCTALNCTTKKGTRKKIYDTAAKGVGWYAINIMQKSSRCYRYALTK